MESTSPSPAGQPSEERRESPRRKKQIRVLYADAEGQEEPSTAWVMDRSLGGLCLAVSRQMEPGTVLNVRPAQAPEEVGWIPVEVTSCRSDAPTWEIGCKFLRAPSYSVLLMFG